MENIKLINDFLKCNVGKIVFKKNKSEIITTLLKLRKIGRAMIRINDVEETFIKEYDHYFYINCNHKDKEQYLKIKYSIPYIYLYLTDLLKKRLSKFEADQIIDEVEIPVCLEYDSSLLK